tara:strand:- start:472 stop:678 length:207 start_codon:yes stop_codon:yes gene_type:complete
MRILNIVTNEFILEKQKLEAELERCLNIQDEEMTLKIDKLKSLINKLSETNQNIMTWESYINKFKEEK